MRLMNGLLVALFWVSVAGASENNYSGFKKRLDAGATCQELFSLRNAFNPKSAYKPKINEDLRGIGCYSSSSVRSSGGSGERKSVESFTVNQYRMYRTIIDTPMSVPEDQVFQELAKMYGVSVDEVRASIDKVQMMLFQNNWKGTPKSEIKHASDWGRKN